MENEVSAIEKGYSFLGVALFYLFYNNLLLIIVNMKYSWVVYILCCYDGKLYTGVTNNIKKRVHSHNVGEASKFTRARLPVKLLATSRFMTKEDAYRLEYRIKKLPRNKKLQALKEE